MSTLSQMPAPVQSISRRRLDLIESLSFFSACYSVGGLGLVSILLDVSVSIWSVAAAFTITWFVYLLHRVRNARRTGAPASARSRAYCGHPNLVRVLLWSTGLLAVVTSALASVWLPLLLLASVMGMLVYGWGEDGRRPRDMLLVKNACVGTSMSLFWLVLVIVPNIGVWDQVDALWPVALAMMLLVLSDAMYCDLGDMAIDAQTCSRTAPIQWGIDSTRWSVDVCMVLVALVIVLSDAPAHGLSAAWFIIPILLLVFQGLLRLLRPEQIRMAIDGRLILVAASGWLLSDWVSSTT